MSLTRKRYSCPVKGCKFRNIGSNNIMKDHLLMNHTKSIKNIESNTWKDLDLYKCKKCEEKIFTTKGALTRHINRDHKQTHSDSNNIERILSFIPPPTTTEHEWQKLLQWLNILKIEPPTYRQSLWLKTNTSSKTKIKHLYHRLILVLINSPNATNDRPLVPRLHRIEVIWKLGIIFESIMLYPLEDTNEGTATQISQRIHSFKTGKIHELYKKSRNVKIKSPEEKQKKIKDIDEDANIICAQLAADNDQYRSAICRLCADTPVALNTPDVVEILQRLYPNKHTITHTHTTKNLTTTGKSNR